MSAYNQPYTVWGMIRGHWVSFAFTVFWAISFALNVYHYGIESLVVFKFDCDKKSVCTLQNGSFAMWISTLFFAGSATVFGTVVGTEKSSREKYPNLFKYKPKPKLKKIRKWNPKDWK